MVVVVVITTTRKKQQEHDTQPSRYKNPTTFEN
jgi:hypothetical protein